MEPAEFDAAGTDEPDEVRRRVGLAGSGAFSFELVGKPPGHASPDSERTRPALDGRFPVRTDRGGAE